MTDSASLKLKGIRRGLSVARRGNDHHTIYGSLHAENNSCTILPSQPKIDSAHFDSSTQFVVVVTWPHVSRRTLHYFRFFSAV